MESLSSGVGGSDLTAHRASPSGLALNSDSPVLSPSSRTSPTPSSPSEVSSTEGERDLLDMSSNLNETLMDEEKETTHVVNYPPPSLPSLPASPEPSSNRTVRPLPRAHSVTSPTLKPQTNVYALRAVPFAARGDLITPSQNRLPPSLGTTAVNSTAASTHNDEESVVDTHSVREESEVYTGSVLEVDSAEPSPTTGYSYSTTPSPSDLPSLPNLPPLSTSHVPSASLPTPGIGVPSLHVIDLRELLSSQPLSPEDGAEAAEEQAAEKDYEEGDLNEALSEVRLLVESYAALREQVAATSVSVEETTGRIIDAIHKHKCPDAKADDTHLEGLSKAEARIVRYKRHIDTLALRVQSAETRNREAETARACRLADVKRLETMVVQGQEDLQTSERHGEMLGRKLSEAVNNVAALQVENEDFRANHSVLRKTQASTPSFVLILLEGEGCMFDPDLLALGGDGGRNLSRPPQGNGGSALNPNIQADFIASDTQFEEFLEGMSESGPLCSISDVPGKFGASTKIRGQMASFGMLDSCGMVFIVAANDRGYLAEVSEWERSSGRVVDKLFAARSTTDRRDDPFRSLGDDRLFAVQCLFPTSPAEWARLMTTTSIRPERNVPANRGHLLMDQTGATTAQALPLAIQPNPALVPNDVSHNQTLRCAPGATPDTYRGQLGSPIPFSPMPTGVRCPDRGRHDPSPPPLPTPRAPRAPQVTSLPVPKYTSRQNPAPRMAGPPWQEYRPASSKGARLPEMLRRSIAAGTATPPRHSNDCVAFRKSARSPSIGGSPPSTDEDNPLDPTIPPAARTHVERPPRFVGPNRSVTGSTTGAPPSGFRVRDGWGRH
ncbi:hypothetical protein CcaverHIS631_0604450 [Cutaneotrichosporon cavernicola]|nr:hypothetical protein CcaverHIS631_0604450 [Cutaneotrichosporon cavernicola]BEJ09530.1 hypothetical protein CcaverHIS641_0604450 [Cutaneotrichosporon cavernicola]